MNKHFRLLALLLLVTFAACSKRESLQTEADLPGAGSETAQPVIDACALLTSEEIKSVQGERVKETKPLLKSQGGLSFFQCYFALPTFTNSISLQVVQKGQGSAGRDPKKVWEEIFAPEKLLEVETAGGKKKSPPQRIPDLGDAAFWAGDQKLGAVYVLKGNCYITISVGGADDQATKVEKCKTLAQMVLKRL